MSYGIFLWHMPLMSTFADLIDERGPVVFACVVLLGSIAAGTLSYLLIEGPLQRLSHRISGHRRPAPEPVGA